VTGQDRVRPIIFGEVLFDRFPDGNEVLGGAPFNVAWNLQALGLAPVFVSRIGDDDLGRRIQQAMADWGLDRSALQVDSEHPTGAVDVEVKNGEPTFTIAPERAYDYIATSGLPDLLSDSLVYHGSLGLRHPVTRSTWKEWTAASAVSLFLDVNLRPPFWNREEVLEWIRRATWVKLNDNELSEMVPGVKAPVEQAHELMTSTGLETLILTRGEQGVLMFTAESGEHSPPPVSASRVRDTVGAGDAFSSVVILGLTRNWVWPVILQRALEFAAAVVGLQGATTTDKEFYLRFKQDWELS